MANSPLCTHTYKHNESRSFRFEQSSRRARNLIGGVLMYDDNQITDARQRNLPNVEVLISKSMKQLNHPLGVS